MRRKKIAEQFAHLQIIIPALARPALLDVKRSSERYLNNLVDFHGDVEHTIQVIFIQVVTVDVNAGD